MTLRISKFLLVTTIISFSLLVNAHFISAQEIPGVTCGIPGTGDSSEKCCSLEIPEEATPGSQLRQSIDNVNQNPAYACTAGAPSSTNSTDPGCKCVLPSDPKDTKSPLEKACERVRFDNPSEKDYCLGCVRGGATWTALGCVPSTLQGFIGDFLLSNLIGLAGIISILCIIYSAFLLQTARGNQERVKKAREYLTACIMGLLLIIFSIFILRLLGVSILKIPGFI